MVKAGDAVDEFIEQLLPLLLVECKAAAIDENTYWQAAGYNAFLSAPFVCLAHSGGIRTYWKEGENLRSVNFLPPYQQLLARASS